LAFWRGLFNRKHAAIKLPKVGWVRLRGFRKLDGVLRSITIRWKAGHWYAAIAWHKEVLDPEPNNLPTIGIDRGVVNFVAFSDGRPSIKGPNSFKRMQDKLAKAQRYPMRCSNLPCVRAILRISDSRTTIR
jgi:putative transposase